MDSIDCDPFRQGRTSLQKGDRSPFDQQRIGLQPLRDSGSIGTTVDESVHAGHSQSYGLSESVGLNENVVVALPTMIDSSAEGETAHFSDEQRETT